MADQRALRDPASRRPRTGLRRSDDAGFTLVEIAIVLVVIGLLWIPVIQGARLKLE